MKLQIFVTVKMLYSDCIWSVTDPRSWSRSDVYRWLELMSKSCDVQVDSDRFRMNGKALCLMTRDMFTYRVPRGGVVLYTDFQMRLCRAVALALHCSVTHQ